MDSRSPRAATNIQNALRVSGLDCRLYRRRRTKLLHSLLQKAGNTMKHSATMALMVTLGVTGVYAQQRPVRMTFSGNGSGNAIDLKYSGATTVEENVAGIGTLGAF